MYVHPLLEEQNGNITGYEIELTNLDSADVKIFETTATTFLIESLRPHTVYSVTVAARTAVGIGPFSEAAVFQTKEDGKHMFCY